MGFERYVNAPSNVWSSDILAYAQVAELVDALASGASDHRGRGSSSLLLGTKLSFQEMLETQTGCRLQPVIAVGYWRNTRQFTPLLSGFSR